MPKLHRWIFAFMTIVLASCFHESATNEVLMANDARMLYVSHGKCGTPEATRALSAPRAVLARGVDYTDDAVKLWTMLGEASHKMGCPADSRAAYRQIISVYSEKTLARERAQDALDAMGPET